MPYNLANDVEKKVKELFTAYNEDRKIIEELDQLEPTLKAFYGNKVYRIGTAAIVAHVDSLLAVAPLLEILTHDELSFTDSGDKYAASNNRDYTRSDGLRVMCYANGAKCKKVQIGTEEVPIYKIECEE